MKFEDMTVEEVHRRTEGEGAVQRGKPLYADRAWTQVRDEMVESDVRTVGDLSPARVRVLRAATTTQASSVRAGRLVSEGSG